MQTGEERPLPLDRQIIFFQRTISQERKKKNLYEIIFQPLRCSPLEIMLKGSLVLISQIMVMNNKENGWPLLANFQLKTLKVTLWSKWLFFFPMHVFTLHCQVCCQHNVAYKVLAASLFTSRIPENWVRGKAFSA